MNSSWDKRFKQHSPVVVIVFVFLGICAVCLNNIIIYSPDSARYLQWAKSLAFFKGFYDDTNPDPTRYVVHAPLYPVLLAPAARFFPYSVVAAKVITAVFGAFSLFLFSWWLGRKLTKGFVVLACLILALNPLMIIYSTQILSDVPFIACLILFFILLERIDINSDPNVMVLLLVTITAGFLLREVGLTIMTAAVTVYLLRKDYRRALLCFAVPVFVYLLWVIRNELIVAPVELPSMKNSQVFFIHLFTPQESSLFQELRERVWNNAKVYKDLMGTLLYLPGYVSTSYAAISRDAQLVRFAYSFVAFMKVPIMVGTIGFPIFGIVSSWRESIAPKTTIVFVILYSIPILLYPINDIRFLLPVLIIMLYHGIVGLSKLIDLLQPKLNATSVRVGTGLIVALSMVPNIVWVADYLANNLSYGKIYSEKDPSTELQTLPEFFRRPVDLAGKAITKLGDSSVTVGTVWKEVCFWLEGRKVVEINPYIIADAFDYAIRDYDVRYLLVAIGTSGLREYEAQMAQSRRFDFNMIERIGNLEILQVSERMPPPKGGPARLDQHLQSQSEFEHVEERLREGVRLLETDPAQAESVFKDLWNNAGSFGTVVFYTAVAKEFADNLVPANNLFKRFSSLPQAGGLLTQAWYHQEIISRLQEAQKETDPTNRAQKFHVLAVNYWEIGFRKRAMEMLHRSLESDPSFFPSIVFGSVYSLQTADTVASRQFFERAARFEPKNELVQGLGSVFSRFDTLNQRLHYDAVSQRVGVARDYIRIGLRENAVDELLRVLKDDPNNVEALKELADLYIFKRRLAPAKRILVRLLSLNQNDKDARKKLNELEERW